MRPILSWLTSIANFLLDNLFDVLAVAASTYMVVRHQFHPYGPNDIGVLATGILAVLSLTAISNLWQQHKRLRSIENVSNQTYQDARKILEIATTSFSGITAVQDKYRFDPHFWQSVLEESSLKLDLLGHALSTWCEHPYSESFARHLKRIAQANGTVRIVVLDPAGESHARRLRILGKSYQERVELTLSFLKEQVIDKLTTAKQKNIVVKYVSDNDIPYMLIRTERHVFVSPYLQRTDGKDNLLVSIDADSKYASVYMNDFQKIFDSAKNVSWTS